MTIEVNWLAHREAQRRVRDLRRSEAAALWQHWGALVAMAHLHDESKWQLGLVVDAWRDTRRRLEAAAMWRHWQGLVAMAAMGTMLRQATSWLAGAYKLHRRNEALRTWQAITGVLVFAAYVTTARSSDLTGSTASR